MESYIEVSLLHNFITVVISTLMATYASLQPISFKRILIYASVQASTSCIFWFSNAWVLSVVVELLFFLVFFRYAYKTYVISLVTRFLWLCTAFVMYDGGFHNGAYFVPMDQPIYILWAIYGVCMLLLLAKWKDFVAELSYVYSLKLYTKQKILPLRGYLDSGNLITFKNVPILFLDKKYYAYFQNQGIELVVMNTITDTDVIRCYDCELQLSGCKKQRVFVNCEKSLELPLHCELLLNMKVMTLG